MSAQKDILDRLDTSSLDDVVRTFPAVLEGLRATYVELEARASRVEDELCRTNTELERRIDELDGLKRHLEAVLESLPCGVVVRDAEGRIVDANSAAAQILGVDARELERTGDHPALQGERADGKPHEVELTGGRRVVVASSYSRIRRDAGDLAGSVEILDDQTERVEMIERLHAGDKMAALGTMAAGVAHEIRNPLNAIKGFAALLVRRNEWSDTTSRWCNLIVEAAAEADTIIENMLSFGSPERLRREAIDAAELLESAIRLATPEGSLATVTLESDAPAFLGDRIKLRQAVRNLVANALDAHDDRDAAQVEVKLWREDDEIVIRVSDSGPGVPPALRSKIFDPFYTNHPDGTGLGLALVSTIVRLHEGSVRVSPEPSHLGGAAFVIRFPFQPARIAV